MADTSVTSLRLLNTFGEIALKFGFTTIPNSLIAFEEELKITNSEFKFLMKLIRFLVPIYRQRKDKKIVTEIITDRLLNMRGNLSAIRKSLIKKGFIDVHKDYLNGKCFGTWYDLTGIFNKIEKIVIEKEVKIEIASDEFADEQKYFDFYSQTEKYEIKKCEEKVKEINEKQKDSEYKKDTSEIKTFVNIWEKINGSCCLDIENMKEAEVAIKTYKPEEKEIEAVLTALQSYPENLQIKYLADRFKNINKKKEKDKLKREIAEQREKEKLIEKENREREEKNAKEEEAQKLKLEAKNLGLTEDEYSEYIIAKIKYEFDKNTLDDYQHYLIKKVEMHTFTGVVI